MAAGLCALVSASSYAILLLIYYTFQQHVLLLKCNAYLIRDVCQDQLLKQEAEEPPELAGLWISTQCEARPENEYLVRHYRFYLNATFELHQFYYNTPNCDRNPVYSVTAYGRFRGMQRSWILLGGVEAEYALYKVIVTPHNRDALRQIRPLYEQQCLHAKLDHDYWTVNTPFVILRDDSVMLNPLMAGRTLTQGVTSSGGGSPMPIPTPTAGGASNMFGALDSSSSPARGVPVAVENSTNNSFATSNAEDSAELNRRPSVAANGASPRSPPPGNSYQNVLPIPTSIRLRTSATASAAAAAAAAAASAVDTPLDCLELFNITFNELQLFRVEKSFWLQQAASHSSEVHHEAWQVHHRQRMSRLLWLGNIYPHYQWRSEFKPASYQIFPLHFADGLVLTTSKPSPSSFLGPPAPTLSTPIDSTRQNEQSALISSLIGFVENQQQHSRANSASQRQRSNQANNINFQRFPPVLPQAQPQSAHQKWLPLAFTPNPPVTNATIVAQNKLKEVLIYQTIAGAWHSTHNCEVEEDGAFIRREVLFGPRGEWSMMNTHYRDAACQQKLRTDLGIGRWTLDNSANDEFGSTNSNDSLPFIPRDTEASRRRQLIDSLEKINNEFSDTLRLPSERLYRQTGGDAGGAKSVQVDPPLQLDDLAAQVQVNVDQMFITLHDTSLVSVMKDTGCGHNAWAVDVRVNVTALPQCHRLGIRVPSTRHTSLLLYRDLYGNLLLFVALHVGRTSSAARDSSASSAAAGVPAPLRATPRRSASASSLNSAYYAKESGGGKSSLNYQGDNNDVLVLRHPLVNCKKRGMEFNLLPLPSPAPSASSSIPTLAVSSSSSKSTIAQLATKSTAPPRVAPPTAVNDESADAFFRESNNILRPYELPKNFFTTTASSTKASSFSSAQNSPTASNEFAWTSARNNEVNIRQQPASSRAPHVFVPLSNVRNRQQSAAPAYSSSLADNPPSRTTTTTTWQPRPPTASSPVIVVTYDVGNDAVDAETTTSAASADAEQQANMMVDEQSSGRSGSSKEWPCIVVQFSSTIILFILFSVYSG